MEPQIRYVRSTDGTRIAVATVGQGPPLVILPTTWLTTIDSYWQVPSSRANLERLAQKRKIVTYDDRGYGLSEREVSDFSLEARVGDLTAVVDALEGAVVDLFAMAYSGTAAISYAARHPDRVGHLVLSNASARGRDLIGTRRQLVLRPMIEVDWELYIQTQVLVTQGWTEAGRIVAESIAGAVTADVFLATIRAARQDDVTELLPHVKCPTLVTVQRNREITTMGSARQLVAALQNARLALTDQQDPLTLAHDPSMRIIQAFLDEEEYEPRGGQVAESPLRSGMSAILFTDLVGHTEMMSRLGDQRGREVLRDHERITREILKAHGGAEVKTTGDGFMASFGSATKAIECAVALQRALAEREGEPLSARVGINAGEPIEEKGDLFGATVILASRIAAKAEGDEILVADTVRGLCSGKGFLFSDRGEFVAKGFEEPVRVYEVRWRE